MCGASLNLPSADKRRWSHGDEQGALTDGRRDSGDPLSVHRIRVGGAGLHRYRLFQEMALGAPPHVPAVPHSGDRCRGGPGVGEPVVSPDALGERTPEGGRRPALYRDIRPVLAWQIGVL